MDTSETIELDLGSGATLMPQASKVAGWLDVLPPKAECLRDYQRSMVVDIAARIAQFRRVLVQAPTGSGKTTIFAIIASAAATAGLRVLILATRTRLVRQIHDRLDDFKVGHGVIAAAMPGYTLWSSQVQVASVDTLYRRCVANRKMPLPMADLVVFDEAHLALGASRQALLDSYPQAIILGFTATPAKTSGASLRDQFEVLVPGPSVTDLIAQGYLCPVRVFHKPVMTGHELKGIKTDAKTGDYATGQLSTLMSRPKLVGDVVTNWLKIANGKRTLVFACDKGHGAGIVEEFRKAGVAAELLTDADDDETREEVIGRLESGATHVIVNCFLLSYGIDIPRVECVVLARPTRSVVLYLQAVGRGMRPADGKPHMILIDHGRVVESLGRPVYDREWSIDDDANVNKQAKIAHERMSSEERPTTCKECGCMWVRSEDGSNCPNCGWTFVPKIKPVQVASADLAEESPQTLDETRAMEEFFRQAISWYANRWPDRWQQKPNSGRYWGWINTREKFKRPDDERIPGFFWNLSPMPCGDEVTGWLKASMIRWAKGQHNQRNSQKKPEFMTLDAVWDNSQKVPF